MSQENELIERAQSGDKEAFCLLARSYERRIYALAFHYTRDPHDAEDLSQEVWLKAFCAISSYRSEASFYTWLRQIAINTLLNQRRGLSFMWDAQKKVIRMGELVSLEALGLEPALPARQVEAELHQKLMAERVMDALSEVPPRQRLIFLLKHREGMTYEEISVACGTSVGTIKKTLFRTVSRLREHLGIRTQTAEFSNVAAAEKH